MKIVISFVVLLSLFSTVRTQGGNRPQIVGDILPEVKERSQTGRLSCKAIQLSSSSTVQWVKTKGPSGSPVQITEGDSIQIDYQVEGKDKYSVEVTEGANQAKTYNLVIRSLTEVDSGNYTCQIRIASVSHSEWPKKIGLLTVQIPPTINTASKARLSVEQGENVTLVCKADGIPAPNVTWIRGDGNLLPDGAFRYRGGNYHITEMNFTHRGQFICIADNNVKPPAMYPVQVDVRFKPFAKPVQSTVGQKQNFDVKLECEISANPDAEVIWYQENKETQQLQQINDNDVYKLNQKYFPSLKVDTKLYTLTIMNVQSGHYTFYYCTATNRYGTGRAKLQVFETMECQGQNCPSISAGRGAPVCRLSTVAFVLNIIVCIITTKHFRNLF